MKRLKHIINYLKAKWNIERNWDFWAIMIVFSIAGSFIGFERQIVFHALGISDHTPIWKKILIYLPLIPPLYQINLLVFSLPLGQFPFFWEKEKRLGRFLRRALFRV